jgi:nickel-dependent lactate racemase
MPELFRIVTALLHDARRLDFMVALGTHPPLLDAQMLRLLGLHEEERASAYRHVGLYNHSWDHPEALVSLGRMEQDEIRHIAGSHWHASLPDSIDIRINRAATEYDHLLIIGPTFPHEVVGFSGGAKYLFPGISGPEMINATHWLGALAGVVNTIGIADTPVRAMIQAAARRLQTPVTLAAVVVDGHEPVGVFTGDLTQAWRAAAEFSAARHIRWLDRPIRKVLSCAPAMYDELWTAGKAMYKLEPAVAPGGEVIIFAPHLSEVSYTHGRYIREIGYHTLAYFLADWERYRHIPLGVLAHSTHVRGGGLIENGVEKPNLRVTLASQIPPEECARLNLGYLDPARVAPDDFQNREDEGIFYIPRAGEILYRLAGDARLP